MTDRFAPTEDARRPQPAPPGSIVDMRDAPPPPRTDAQAAETAPPVESTLVGGRAGLPPMTPRDADRPKDAGTIVAAGPQDAGKADLPARAGGSVLTGLGGGPDDADKARPAMPSLADPADEQPRPAPQAAPAQPDRTAAAAQVRPAPAPRRGGFAPLFLGGLVAAGLGAGAAYWAIPRLPPAWRTAPASAPAIDTDAVAGIAAQAARAELDTRAAALESQVATAAAEAASRAAGASVSTQALLDQARQAGSDAGSQAGTQAATRLIAETPATAQPDASVAATLSAQASQIAELDRKLAELGSQPQTPDLTAELEPIRQRITALEQRPAVDPDTARQLGQLAAQAQTATDRIGQVADQAESRLREAEGRAAQLASAADDAARRARAAAAAAALGEAVQTGAPREQALAQLQDAGVQPPAALAADIPTLDALAAEFPAAARAALRADLRSDAASGSGSIVGNFLRAQTGARSVTPRAGTDADAVLSRAQDAIQRGAIARALTELEALPPAARPAMQAWTDRARAYADAQAALGTMIAPQDAAAGAPAAANAAPATAPAGAPPDAAPAPDATTKDPAAPAGAPTAVTPAPSAAAPATPPASAATPSN